MRSPLPYSVILLPSTSHALRAEKLIIENGYTCKLIPVPRNIRSDCGVCVRIESQIKAEILPLLSQAKMNVEGVVDLPYK